MARYRDSFTFFTLLQQSSKYIFPLINVRLFTTVVTNGGRLVHKYIGQETENERTNYTPFFLIFN
jgi:hypothetical protein